MGVGDDNGMGGPGTESRWEPAPKIQESSPVAPAADQPSAALGYAGMPTYSRGDKEYASKTQAAVARAQWEDYKLRFAPYEDRLLSMINNGANLDSVIQRGDRAIASGFGNAQRGLQMGLRKYGLGQSADEAAVSQREQQLGQASAKAGLRNTARLHAYDRDLDIMSGTGGAVGGMKGMVET